MTFFHVITAKGTSASRGVTLQKTRVVWAELSELKLGSPEPCLDGTSKSGISLAEMPGPSPWTEHTLVLMVPQEMTQQS